MEDESYSGLSSSRLLGSVPAVVKDEKNSGTYVAPEVNPQIFPSNSGDGGRGYGSIGGPSEKDMGRTGDRSGNNDSYLRCCVYAYDSKFQVNVASDDGEGQPSTTNWQGMFSISSYTQYFNVDTDVVINRLLSSLNPTSGDFFSKIDANPDLYGLIWVSTTLIVMIAALGNVATYLIERVSDSSTAWSFNVGYVNLAVGVIYGYAIVVPLAFFFLIQYLGSNANLVRFWCMWGYSLFIFVLSAIVLLIPVEFVRWMIILGASGVSACFVASNLRSYVQGNDLTIVLLAAFVLQVALGLFIKICFFP